METLKAQQAATTALTAALEHNAIPELEAALAAAERCGLNTGKVRDAQRRLDTLRRMAELEAALAAAVRR